VGITNTPFAPTNAEEALTLEKSLNLNNPKLQLLLDNSSMKMSIKDNLYKTKHHQSQLEELLSEEMIYYYERKLRKLYDDDELHALIISLMLTLLITPNSGILEPMYCSQHPVSKFSHSFFFFFLSTYSNPSQWDVQLSAHPALSHESQVEQTHSPSDIGQDE
jgi:hypothetical protein